ncbi:hypothetical protein N431DRAFT_456238 [Stipitochalara longipes BDJ]|nr:hypothetical protein N431DRAFT_456238 [Stipitochalara longipes BDJ]
MTKSDLTRKPADPSISSHKAVLVLDSTTRRPKPLRCTALHCTARHRSSRAKTAAHRARTLRTCEHENRQHANHPQLQRQRQLQLHRSTAPESQARRRAGFRTQDSGRTPKSRFTSCTCLASHAHAFTHPQIPHNSYLCPVGTASSTLEGLSELQESNFPGCRTPSLYPPRLTSACTSRPADLPLDAPSSASLAVWTRLDERLDRELNLLYAISSDYIPERQPFWLRSTPRTLSISSCASADFLRRLDELGNFRAASPAIQDITAPVGFNRNNSDLTLGRLFSFARKQKFPPCYSDISLHRTNLWLVPQTLQDTEEKGFTQGISRPRSI